MISKEQLSELERLEREATAGEYRAARINGVAWLERFESGKAKMGYKSNPMEREDWDQLYKDTLCLAAARNAMPDLLATIKEQREVIEYVTRRLDFVDQCGANTCVECMHAVQAALAKSRAGDGG